MVTMFLWLKIPYKSPLVVTWQKKKKKKETYRQIHSSLTKLQIMCKPFFDLATNQFPEQVGFG